MFLGGEVIWDLILRESDEPRGARDVELGTFYFFGSKKMLAGTDVWTPYSENTKKSSVEVYVDDFMSIVIPTSKAQLDHVANPIMRGIHDVFPANIVDSNGPISEKKLKKGEAQYSTFKQR
jgi:hypothetical protein